MEHVESDEDLVEIESRHLVDTIEDTIFLEETFSPRSEGLETLRSLRIV